MKLREGVRIGGGGGGRGPWARFHDQRSKNEAAGGFTLPHLLTTDGAQKPRRMHSPVLAGFGEGGGGILCLGRGRRRRRGIVRFAH